MAAPAKIVTSRSGLRAEISAAGAVRRLDCGPTTLTLFIGNEVECGPANLFLRRRAGSGDWTPLLGPLSPTRLGTPASGRLEGSGTWQGIDYDIALVLAADAPVWFWHVHLRNTSAQVQELDLTYAQDLALAPYGAVRMNEYYVSQYIDHTPLSDPERGTLIASRQNQAAEGRIPWSLIGSLRRAGSFATDALDFHGLASRAGEPPVGIVGELPDRRLQHEHSMAVLRDEPLRLGPGEGLHAGFFGLFVADHPEATSAADLSRVSSVLTLPEAAPAAVSIDPTAADGGARTLFSAATPLQAADLETQALRRLFPPPWRHEETDERGARLSFFHGSDSHVVLRAKELRVLRPHGQLLRTGRHLTPDESALTSTVWMSGVFHSMLAQGHVSINRFLSANRSYLGLFRSQGLRVFARIAGEWRLLGVPSAFEMAPESCRWIYRHAGGEIQVRSAARTGPHALTLDIEVTSGPDTAFLICQHVALNGDDGNAPEPLGWRRSGDTLIVTATPGSDVGRRFPGGEFRITLTPAAIAHRVGTDEMLFLDARSRQEPYLCIETPATRRAGLSVRGFLVDEESQKPWRLPAGEPLTPGLTVAATASGEPGERAAQLAAMVPWYTQNALVHYLSPRGLEQYSGGGWGTRDVCQGPVEMLLALARTEPLRDLVLRVMANQNPDGDWPQWFMFFERERGIRAGDSHGDIVFWPLLALAQYLIASGDAGILDASVPFFHPKGPDAGEPATVWQHLERAFSLIDRRRISGTTLAAYGHGDWNDSLQPADPKLRERMCSAWTVTLHFQTLMTLARALRSLGRGAQAEPLERQAAAVRADFQRLLLPDGVLTGYAVFDGTDIRYILHPRDATTGVHYSSLAMIHAILEDLLTPDQTRAHLEIVGSELSGPDGVRLFDRPMPYHGGPQRIFQRAESATFFGREIGLMYMHAHLRYAQALAHVGLAAEFFRALCQANPIGIRSVVPAATLRQANCYYSSSDAAFADRYQARAEYARIRSGTIPLDGGWRVYSSGAGIALALTLRHFLGLTWEARALCVDPVMPGVLDGMRVMTSARGYPLEVTYRVGASGSGVNEIVLNGEKLPFTREANPHRRGAARVAAEAVLDRLTRSRNTLAIDLG